MTISSIKYQIVVIHDGGFKMVMESGTGSMIMRDDRNELELQRVEVLKG